MEVLLYGPSYSYQSVIFGVPWLEYDLELHDLLWCGLYFEMLRKYLRDLGDPLVFLSYCGHTMVTFKFYSFAEEDSLKLHYTFSNLEDLEDQLTSYGYNSIMY